MTAIRPERAGDEAAIRALTSAAFAASRHGDNGEAGIVDGLRAAGSLAVSLVATNRAIVGHVAFSPVTIGLHDCGWFGLGPVSVAPERQREGLGQRLIEAGLARLTDIGAAGCVVLGDPAYYCRFGFRSDPALTYPGPPAEYFQALVLSGEVVAGEVRYAPPFG